MSQQETTKAPQPAAPENGAPKKSKVFPIVMLAIVAVGGVFGFMKYLHAQHHEETDDAQVESNVSPVIPRIAGYVVEVRVKDNQKVKKGDTLVILDNRNELIQVQQMTAALNAAISNMGVANASSQASTQTIGNYVANESTASAQIEAAKVTLTRATQDYNRYANLIKDHSVTQQQFEQAEAAKLSAERQLQVLMDQQTAAKSQTHTAQTQATVTREQVNVTSATIEQRKADLENAKLNLSYTVITAPDDGQVSRVNVQLGQYLQPGQMLFSIVSMEQPWVVANFKETQMAKIRPGLKVTLHIDTYPGHEFEAKVASISPATGAKFALLPPDNASGNFVKTVQRMPVRIEFTSGDAYLTSLRAGMNAMVDVHID